MTRIRYPTRLIERNQLSLLDRIQQTDLSSGTLEDRADLAALYREDARTMAAEKGRPAGDLVRIGSFADDRDCLADRINHLVEGGNHWIDSAQFSDLENYLNGNGGASTA